MKDREPAYTDPEIIDRICEAVIAKLPTDGLGNLLLKQDDGSSNLLTRSKFICGIKPCEILLLGNPYSAAIIFLYLST